MSLFQKKIIEDIWGHGGSIEKKELKRIVGVKYKVKKDEFPDMLAELEKTNKVKVKKKKIELVDFI